MTAHLNSAFVIFSLPRSKNPFYLFPPWLYFQFYSYCSVSSFSPSAVFRHSYIPFTLSLTPSSTSLVLISSPDFIFIIGVSSHSSSLLNRIFCEPLAFFPPLYAFVSSHPFIPLTWSPLSISLCAIISCPGNVIYHCRAILYRWLPDSLDGWHKQLLGCVFIECSDGAKIAAQSSANVHLSVLFIHQLGPVEPSSKFPFLQGC